MRHGQQCRWRNLPVGQPGGRDRAYLLSDPYCSCDPYGDKARARAEAIDKFNRAHVLWQNRVWYSADKELGAIPLKQMSLRYKQNVVAFLERRAPYLKCASEWRLALNPGVQGEHALDAVDDLLRESMETDALIWLHRTPLVKRLDKLIAKGQDGAVD